MQNLTSSTASKVGCIASGGRLKRLLRSVCGHRWLQLHLVATFRCNFFVLVISIHLFLHCNLFVHLFISLSFSCTLSIFGFCKTIFFSISLDGHGGETQNAPWRWKEDNKSSSSSKRSSKMEVKRQSSIFHCHCLKLPFQDNCGNFWLHGHGNHLWVKGSCNV